MSSPRLAPKNDSEPSNIKETTAQDIVQNKDYSKGYAEHLDASDPLRHLRAEFLIPSQVDLKRPTLSIPSSEPHSEPSIYLCGNSLGVQPRRTQERVLSCLTAWATKGVTGHFTEHEDSKMPGFMHADEYAARLMAPIVGAEVGEVAVMGTLTSNLHLLMASFYRPTRKKYKILLEGKAFPSDHVCTGARLVCCRLIRLAVCSGVPDQIPWLRYFRRHGLDIAF